MVNRPNAREPKPMSRPKRLLASILAVTLACGLGAIITATHRHNDEAGARAQPASTPETTSAPGKTGGDASSRWVGLEHAGIPTPGEWSRPRYWSSVVKDGQVVGWAAEGTPNAHVTMPANTGAIDAALNTLNRLLDPNADDQTWADNVKATLGADAAGLEYGYPSAPRWWWLERRYDPDAVCTGSIYVAGRSWGCSTDGTYTGEQAINNAVRYDPNETRFPVPKRYKVDSRVNPQEHLSRYYDTVVVPMDDGPWHVTVYCPADRGASDGWNYAQPGTVTDEHGNETDLASITDGVAVQSIESVGFGTRQHPCVTVDVSVGGQTPYWYAGTEGR